MLNLGHAVTYPGTVTAAMESITWGVPAIAFSLGCIESGLAAADYNTAATRARIIVGAALQHSLPEGTLLNVNLPML